MSALLACCLLVLWLTPATCAGSCPELPPVNNSIFVAEEVAGQTLGTYVCVEGYHLVGEQSLVCMAPQGWSGHLPRCQEGHCPDPVLVHGWTSTKGPARLNDTVKFHCQEDYILQGSTWSRCLQNHSWSPPLPTCKSRHCGHPGNPAHGYFKGSDFNTGSVITYFCEARYRLKGTQRQQCVDGEWSGALPVCVPEPPKSASQQALDKALLAFQESGELCQALHHFTQSLKESGFLMRDLKYSLELKKAELEARVHLDPVPVQLE